MQSLSTVHLSLTCHTVSPHGTLVPQRPSVFSHHRILFSSSCTRGVHIESWVLPVSHKVSSLSRFGLSNLPLKLASQTCLSNLPLVSHEVSSLPIWPLKLASQTCLSPFATQTCLSPFASQTCLSLASLLPLASLPLVRTRHTRGLPSIAPCHPSLFLDLARARSGRR